MSSEKTKDNLADLNLRQGNFIVSHSYRNIHFPSKNTKTACDNLVISFISIYPAYQKTRIRYNKYKKENPKETEI